MNGRPGYHGGGRIVWGAILIALGLVYMLDSLGVLSAGDLAGCRARFVPSLEIHYRGYSLHAARGLTAGPTLADVLDRLSSRRYPQAPDAALGWRRLRTG